MKVPSCLGSPDTSFWVASTRHYGSHWGVERFRDFFVGKAFEIEKAQRGPEDWVELLEAVNGFGGVDSVSFSWNSWIGLISCQFQARFGKTLFVAIVMDEFFVQHAEQT